MLTVEEGPMKSAFISGGLGGNPFGKGGLYPVQDHTPGVAFGKFGPVFASCARAFGQVADFKVKPVSVHHVVHI